MVRRALDLYSVAHDKVPVTTPNNGQEQRDIKRVIIFGVVMATIEMAVLLALLYC